MRKVEMTTGNRSRGDVLKSLRKFCDAETREIVNGNPATGSMEEMRIKCRENHVRHLHRVYMKALDDD